MGTGHPAGFWPVEFSRATGCQRAGSQFPGAEGARSARKGDLSGRGAKWGCGGEMRDRGREGGPKRPHTGEEMGEGRERASRPGPPAQTLAPQPALLEAEDANFGEDVHQVTVAEPAVLAGAAPPPAGGRPVPVLLPRLPLLADQAAGDGRGHGGPGPGPEEGGTEGREPRDPGEGRGDAGGGLPSGRRRGGLGRGRRGAQSPLGPIALSAERGARRANAPGARREPEVAAASEPGVGPGLRAPPVTPRAARALSPTGRRRHSRGLAVRPASRTRERAGRLLPGQGVEERRPQGLRVGASRARRAGLSA